MEYDLDIMLPEDWPGIRSIYAEGLDSGLATFETTIPSWANWDAAHLSFCRLVLRDPSSGKIAGWAALSPVSRRAVYAGVAEVSIYIAGQAWGQGLGKTLLLALVQASEREGIWTLQSSIFAKNAASIALHRSCGFREVGRRERIALRDGVWHDTLLFERRSAVAGV